jgi:hypothetical protein
VVDKDDVEEATRLMRVATQQSATDPLTGTIDMDLIATGRSAAVRAALAPRRAASPARRALLARTAARALPHALQLGNHRPCPRCLATTPLPAPPREQARGQLDQLAAALLEELRASAAGALSVAVLHAAIIDKAQVHISLGQVREALDQLKGERSINERAGIVSLV